MQQQCINATVLVVDFQTNKWEINPRKLQNICYQDTLYYFIYF